MANRRIHMKILWVKGSTNINTKFTIYYKCILTEFGDICASECRSHEFLTECVEQVKNVEKKSWKVYPWLKKGRLPLLMSRTSLCLFPNTRCHFVRKKTKKTQLRNINIWKPGRFDSCRPRTCRIWQAFLSCMYTVQAIATYLQENLSTICCPWATSRRPLCQWRHRLLLIRRQELVDNYFCTAITGMNYGWPSK